MTASLRLPVDRGVSGYSAHPSLKTTKAHGGSPVSQPIPALRSLPGSVGYSPPPSCCCCFYCTTINTSSYSSPFSSPGRAARPTTKGGHHQSSNQLITRQEKMQRVNLINEERGWRFDLLIDVLSSSCQKADRLTVCS